MISIEVRGIPCVMDEAPLDNIEVLEVIAEIEEGNIFKVPEFFKVTFGEEQYANIKKSLKGEDGICHTNDIFEFYRECIEAAAKAKKAEAKN